MHHLLRERTFRINRSHFFIFSSYMVRISRDITTGLYKEVDRDENPEYPVIQPAPFFYAQFFFPK